MAHDGWREGAVSIALPGHVFGALGIVWFSAHWSVTHLPSGRAIGHVAALRSKVAEIAAALGVQLGAAPPLVVAVDDE